MEYGTDVPDGFAISTKGDYTVLTVGKNAGCPLAQEARDEARRFESGGMSGVRFVPSPKGGATVAVPSHITADPEGYLNKFQQVATTA